ncbi:MAG TPA: uridine kinase [Bryobacteraceae bacterium]|nr:uridine kinase [Bryobacteraceae bacterium]
MRPFLIGIAGPSCSGKTDFAKALALSLPGAAVIVPLDSYYRRLDHLTYAERCQVNFDHPDALDWPLIVEHVERLARGERIEEPVYLFDQHTRAARAQTILPAPYTLLEGLFTLHSERVRNLLGLKIYISTRDEVCFERRKRRDVEERGRTLESVEWQYNTTVRSMAAEYVLPTRRWADVVVSGEEPIARGLSNVHHYLGTLPGGSSAPQMATDGGNAG